MKNSFWFILILICSFKTAFAQSPLNDNEYNVQVFFQQAYGTIGSDGASNPPEPSWQIKMENDDNNAATQLLSTASGYVNPDTYCYGLTTFSNDWHEFRFDLVGYRQGNTSGKIDIDIFSYENDYGSICVYDADPPGQDLINDDDNANRKAFVYNFAANPVGIAYQQQYDVNADSKVKLAINYYYTNGRRSSPLDFGLITDNAITYGHSYKTVQNSFGFSNDWSASDNAIFTDATDVTYSFELDKAQRVNFDPVFYFDGSAHLVSLDSLGNFIESLASLTDFSNPLEAVFCPGYYAIVIDGNQSSVTGNYTFDLDFSDVPIDGGTLAGGDITVPIPQEFPIQLRSESGAEHSSDISNYLTFGNTSNSLTWEFTDGNGPFVTLSPDSNSTTYTLPQWTETGWFRRGYFDGCQWAYSNDEKVSIYDVANGTISGYVTSGNTPGAGNPVSGVTLSLRRITAVAGGDTTYEHTATTNSAGFYQFTGLFYGFPDSLGANEQVFFEVVPSKFTHEFSPAIKRDEFFYLTKNNPNSPNNNFNDITTFSIIGTVTQECEDCVGATAGNPIVMPLKDVGFKVDGTLDISQSISDGTYALSIDEEGTYLVEPHYAPHGFEPNNQSVAINLNQTEVGIDFVDTTTHRISGYVKADCDQYIGQANLRFTLQKPDGNDGFTAGWQKDITTNNGSGYYDIKLPAGIYKVEVLSFVATVSDFNALEIIDFFDNFPIDSVQRDISTSDTTLNLIFQESPEIVVQGLNATCLAVSSPIFEQSEPKPFNVLVSIAS